MRDNEILVILDGLNARVGEEEIDEITGKWGVPETNTSGQMLIDVCAENNIIVGNTWFRKQNINKVYMTEK